MYVQIFLTCLQHFVAALQKKSCSNELTGPTLREMFDDNDKCSALKAQLFEFLSHGGFCSQDDGSLR